MPNSAVFTFAGTEWSDLGDGIRRKIVGHTSELMNVLVHFRKDAVGKPHFHDAHDQIAFCVSGSFEIEMDGKVSILKPNDAMIIPKHTVHGVRALEEDSVLLDSFSPRRNDFL